MTTSICWFRRDLRLDDNPAWSAATACDRVLAMYVLEPALLEAAGPFRRRTLLAAVTSLAAEIEALGGALHVTEGDAPTALARVSCAVGADAIHANADVTPFATRRDRAVDAEVDVEWHWGTLVQPPGSVLTGTGTLSKVFTPFYRTWATTPLPHRVEPRAEALVIAHQGAMELPQPDEPPPLPMGTAAAHERLASFSEIADDYRELRDLPGTDGTSALSTDLRFGTIGPREVLDMVGTHTPGRDGFVRQLAWRDWYAHHLIGLPSAVDHAIRSEYDAVAWRDDPEAYEAWKLGQTGFPIVDAGMRQLRATGWMHNRVRMIAASFLVKDLLIDWRAGERWFRHLLTDADVSQNVGNWQWVAGTGHDAAPYFRIFNPVLQSRRFDASGDFIKRWVPELSKVPTSMLHAPWEAPPLELAAAGVVLGSDYPAPIVDHDTARTRSVNAYKAALERVP